MFHGTTTSTDEYIFSRNRTIKCNRTQTCRELGFIKHRRHNNPSESHYLTLVNNSLRRTISDWVTSRPRDNIYTYIFREEAFKQQDTRDAQPYYLMISISQSARAVWCISHCMWVDGWFVGGECICAAGRCVWAKYNDDTIPDRASVIASSNILCAMGLN